MCSIFSMATPSFRESGLFFLPSQLGKLRQTDLCRNQTVRTVDDDQNHQCAVEDHAPGGGEAQQLRQQRKDRRAGADDLLGAAPHELRSVCIPGQADDRVDTGIDDRDRMQKSRDRGGRDRSLRKPVEQWKDRCFCKEKEKAKEYFNTPWLLSDRIALELMI